ncbi:TVP38/TMEM64 family protein [Desulfurivibrio sp. D14AmB]|uniref:TVP38/TMEM64 family protein n=1 Tax=Desulfurivibrio sp. D14AmB TaxID=3374370 RepID=UPI00376F15A5
MDELVVKEKKRGLPLKTLILPGLLLAGIAVQYLELVDWFEVLEISRGYAHHWWFPPLITLLMILAYTLALPGSIFIWISGVLFMPGPAALIIALGGLGGAVAAYFFSRRLSDGMTSRITNSPLFAILQRHGDFVALSAVRLLPGFPHSVINYGAGILQLPLTAFVPATLIGFGVKGYLYATAIHQVTRADEGARFVTWQLLAPLLILAGLFLVAKLYMARRLRSRSR